MPNADKLMKIYKVLAVSPQINIRKPNKPTLSMSNIETIVVKK
jgi:hypothetical protein